MNRFYQDMIQALELRVASLEASSGTDITGTPVGPAPRATAPMTFSFAKSFTFAPPVKAYANTTAGKGTYFLRSGRVFGEGSELFTEVVGAIAKVAGGANLYQLEFGADAQFEASQYFWALINLVEKEWSLIATSGATLAASGHAAAGDTDYLAVPIAFVNWDAANEHLVLGGQKSFHTGDICLDGRGDDNVLPDGEEPVGTGKRLHSLGYSYDIGGTFSGYLEDFEAFEKLITADNITNYAYDEAIPYFYYSETDVTTKEYMRIDSSNAAPAKWGTFSSLERDGAVLTLWNFQGGATVKLIEDFSEFPTVAQGYDDYPTLLARYPDSKTLEYVSLTEFKAKYAATADEALNFTPDIDWEHDHGGHSGLGDDDHTQYLILDGDAMRNKMSGLIGDAAGADSIDPNLRVLWDGAFMSAEWGANRILSGFSGFSTVDWGNKLLIDDTAATVMSWNTTSNGGLDWFLNFGTQPFGTNNHWNFTGLEVGSEVPASASGGAIFAHGGIGAALGCYFMRGTSNQAGFFGSVDGPEAFLSARFDLYEVAGGFSGNGAKVELGTSRNGGMAAYFSDETTYIVNIGEGGKAGIDVELGSYWYQGTEGATADDDTYIAGGLWLTKEGKTLMMVKASAVDPTDMVAVWR